jgi:RNA polymerase sigma factor (TIGR02999 family)
MQHVTQILLAIEQGEPAAQSELLPLVYTALRRLAATKLAQERPGQTIQATELVHEAYLRIVAGNAAAGSFSSRSQFFAAAAEAMRRILVERARRKQRLRHGGKLQRIFIRPDELSSPCPNERLLEIDEGLSQLEREFPDKARIVKLKFFAGLTLTETAALLGISTATVQRHWTFARAWLLTHLDERQ